MPRDGVPLEICSALCEEESNKVSVRIEIVEVRFTPAYASMQRTFAVRVYMRIVHYPVPVAADECNSI